MNLSKFELNTEYFILKLYQNNNKSILYIVSKIGPL